MSIIGIDFDNTIICYDNLFYKLAREKQLIDSSVLPHKSSIRNYLIKKGKEDQFTLLQGEVYGLRILEAKPAEGVKDALKNIREKGIKIKIISHKTQTPYRGPKYDLRKAATEWLEAEGFLTSSEIDIGSGNIHYESTKQEKISKILNLQCNHFIDDLEEILDMLPKSENIKKIRYNRYNEKTKYENMISWKMLQKLNLE